MSIQLGRIEIDQDPVFGIWRVHDGHEYVAEYSTESEAIRSVLSREQLAGLRIIDHTPRIWANAVSWETCRELFAMGLVKLSSGDGHEISDAGRAVLAGAK